jgi:hypothetical protein
MGPFRHLAHQESPVIHIADCKGCGLCELVNQAMYTPPDGDVLCVAKSVSGAPLKHKASLIACVMSCCTVLQRAHSPPL